MDNLSDTHPAYVYCKLGYIVCRPQIIYLEGTIDWSYG